MRVNLRTGALVLVLAAAAVTTPGLFLVPPVTDSEVWVCPPCSGGCDEKTYEKAGDCPACGMSLVKTSAAAAMKRTAAEKPLRLDLDSAVEEEKWAPSAGGKESARAWRFSDPDGRVWNAAATIEPLPGDPGARMLTVRVARAS